MRKLNYLQNQLTHFELKYNNRPFYSVFRMICASIFAMFIKESKVYNKKSLKILFEVKGGLGDAVIASNFIYCFYEYIRDADIKISAVYPKQEVLNSIYKGLPKDIILSSSTKRIKTDIYIELNRFPKVPVYIKQKNCKLDKLLKSWYNFFYFNNKFFNSQPKVDALSNYYTEILGQKRINQADIGGTIGIKEDFNYKIPLNNTYTVLNKFHLLNGKYITLAIGIPMTKGSLLNNKLWPYEYYQDLINNIRKQYSNLNIVLIGANKKGCNKNFSNIYTDLRGETSLEDIKVILKNSLLHIDTEGGLVHLRHALKGGPSVVLFGPTSPKVYGYKENLNLRTKKCPRPCEWITNDWMTRCLNRKNQNICMRSLTPNLVFKEIKQFVENNNIFRNRNC